MSGWQRPVPAPRVPHPDRRRPRRPPRPAVSRLRPDTAADVRGNTPQPRRGARAPLPSQPPTPPIDVPPSTYFLDLVSAFAYPCSFALSRRLPLSVMPSFPPPWPAPRSPSGSLLTLQAFVPRRWAAHPSQSSGRVQALPEPSRSAERPFGLRAVLDPANRGAESGAAPMLTRLSALIWSNGHAGHDAQCGHHC